MARPKDKERPIRLNTSFPDNIREKLDAYLKKEGGGKIQVGAYQKFIIARIRAFFGIP